MHHLNKYLHSEKSDWAPLILYFPFDILVSIKIKTDSNLWSEEVWITLVNDKLTYDVVKQIESNISTLSLRVFIRKPRITDQIGQNREWLFSKVLSIVLMKSKQSLAKAWHAKNSCLVAALLAFIKRIGMLDRCIAKHLNTRI